MTNSLEIVERYTYLLNYKRTAISWHLRKQIGVIAYPLYWCLGRFPASQEDKYKDKKIKKISGLLKVFCSATPFQKINFCANPSCVG